MKNLALLFSLLILALQAESAFSYRPLWGSDWARDNPGQLPFSECYLSNQVANEAGIAPWFGGDYAMGCHIDAFESNNFISCRSDDLGIAFSIPISLSKAVTFPALPIYKISGSRYTFSESIDGKSMSELFGIYMGIRLALPIPGGVGAYINSNGVSLTVLEAALGLHAKAGISGFFLDPLASQRQFQIYKKYESNPFVVTGRKLASSTQRDIPLFLTRGKNGEVNLKAKSGALLFIGYPKKGCKLSKHELKINQGLDQAKLVTLNEKACSIIVKLSDGTLISQQHNGSNIVLSDSVIENALGSMKFVRTSHGKN